jgi:hypothetical protein
MKYFFAIVFVLVTALGFSQTTVEKIAKTFSVPDGWKTRVVKDTSFFPSFGRRHVAIWEFKCDDGHTEPMWFYVFKYKKEDSAFFHQKSTMYYALSNCMLVANNDIKENFVSFIRGDYYFVERMCPCYTKTNSSCKTLVSALDKWLEDNKSVPASGGGL